MQGVIMTEELTEKQVRILDVIRDAGDWISRSDVARGIDQDRLYPYDVALLDQLVEQGLVEVRQVERRRAIPYEWQYRSK